jgi:PAS domain S-box-containing protein
MMDLTPRKRAELHLEVRNQQLRYHSELTKTITDNTSEALFLTNLDGRINFMNPAAERKFGWSAEALIGKNLYEKLHPHHAQANTPGEACMLCRGNESSLAETREDSFARADGGILPVRYSRSPVLSYGKVTGAVFGVWDISEWKSSQAALRLSEEKLRQSQKMEAIGRLAGGIAHDFNNLLTVIAGYASLGLERLKPSETMRGYLEEILRSGERAAALTSQLLSYSRKQMLTSKVLDLNDIVNDTVSIVQRTLGEHIAFQVDLHRGPCLVNVDPIHVQQVFVNLAINSRDAMPNGGGLRIGTTPMSIPPGGQAGMPVGIERVAEEGIPAGDYVQFSISDDGHGMDESVQAHLFEPFFTTKEVGKGTGLGLSMAYGIVKQHHGHIQVSSEAGRGCTIRILFPAVRSPKPPEAVKPVPRRQSKGDETVLLVEDEEVVLRFMQKVLAGRGYKVLEAENGLDALAISKRYPGPVDLLVTDVRMRRMGGYELAEALKLERPDMPRIFISGYNEDSDHKRGCDGENSSFLQKPFTPLALTRLVRKVLDRVPVAAP